MTKEELRKKWIEALRSGQYEQGKYCLRDKNDRFCCLGVLCDISDLGEWEDLLPDNSISRDYIIEETNDAAMLPERVRDAAGLFTCDGTVRSMKGRDILGSLSLAAANDQGKTFEKIADMLETYPDLF